MPHNLAEVAFPFASRELLDGLIAEALRMERRWAVIADERFVCRTGGHEICRLAAELTVRRDGRSLRLTALAWGSRTISSLHETLLVTIGVIRHMRLICHAIRRRQQQHRLAHAFAFEVLVADFDASHASRPRRTRSTRSLVQSHAASEQRFKG